MIHYYSLVSHRFFSLMWFKNMIQLPTLNNFSLILHFVNIWRVWFIEVGVVSLSIGIAQFYILCTLVYCLIYFCICHCAQVSDLSINQDNVGPDDICVMGQCLKRWPFSLSNTATNSTDRMWVEPAESWVKRTSTSQEIQWIRSDKK